MTVWTTLLDVVVVLLAAMVLGVVAERLRQSAIVGFMLAGVLLGPYSPLQGVVGGLGENFRLGPNNPELVGDMAQLGVTLLMFTIGLEFNWSRLKTLGSRTLVAGGLQIGLTTAAAAGAGVAFGLEVKAAVALGLALAMSSTAVVLPVLQRISEVDSVHGRFALGVLLVQDAAVVPAVLIVAALNGGGSAGEVVWGTLWSVAVVAGFVLVSWGFSKWAMPTLASLVAPSRNREMPILFAFVAAMGSAWAANELGLSAALGAFIAAVFLGESVLASQLRADLGPFKSVFVTLFFASIGMLFDPAWAWANVWVVAGATAAVVLLKPVVVAVVGLVMRLRVRHAVASGVCLCQIGVFSFVLADVARQAPSGSGAGGGSSVEMREIVSESGEPTLAEGGLRGEFAAGEEVAVSPRELPGGEAEVLPLFSDDLFNLVVAVTILALFFTPYGVGLARPAGGWVERTVRRWGWTQKSGERGEGARDEDGGEEGGAGGAKPQAAGGGDGVGPVIVVGFGPAGRAVAEAVQRRGGEVVVADLNPRSVLEARDRGLRAYVGDASQPDILKLLGAETAAAMVVTLPDHRLTVAVLVEARAANPSLAVVARARYRRYAELIEAAGSWAVVDEETQVGVKLGEELERLMTPRETTSDEGDEDHADEPDAKRDEPHGDRADGDGSHCA